MDWWCRPVAAPSLSARDQARARQQQLTKPSGSLGALEDVAVQFAAWQDRDDPRIEQVAIQVFAADHGVVAEGVSAFPQSVTLQMIQNFAAGGAAICVLARHCGASFAVINLGTATPLPPTQGVLDLQFAPGTANMCSEAAMSETLLLQALQTGADSVTGEPDLYIGGEMGIGNTTAAAALSSALLNLPLEETVGPGTGLGAHGIETKRSAVRRALERHVRPPPGELEILRRLGGLEIAALTGAYIAAAQRGVPVLVDGYICSVAALLACRLNPGVRDWMLFGHCSAEPGHRHVLRALDAQPLLDLGMRLGEGSGAAIALPLLQSACRLHNEMATFAEAGVSEKEDRG